MSSFKQYTVGLALVASPLATAHPAWAGPRNDPDSPFSRPRPEGDRQERALAREARCLDDPRVLLGQVTFDTCLGAELFFRETFEGNGRTCSSCHPAQNNYTLDPAFIAELPDGDPLFVADREPALSLLEVPELLRKYGLILVNPDGLEAPTRKFVMRSVSHMLGIATSTQAPRLRAGSTTIAFDGTRIPPLERLGWSGDGAPGNGELRDFADGAITQHLTRSLSRVSGLDFVLPSDAERDAIAEFSRSIGRMNEVEMDRVHLRDAAAERGRVTFLTGNGLECALSCHRNAGANALDIDEDGNPLMLVNLSRDIGTAVIRVPEVDAMNIPLDGGHGVRPLDLDFDGVLDSFGNGAMNAPPLIEAADTAPMFSTHAFTTLEDAIRFYAGDGFAHSFVGMNVALENREKGAPIPLSETDITEVGRFLRIANTALNIQMASYRASAAREIAGEFGREHQEVQRGLIALADAEVEDALSVLHAADRLAPRARRQLHEVRALLSHAQARACSPRQRVRSLWRAEVELEEALEALGTGLDMEIGAGTLMF